MWVIGKASRRPRRIASATGTAASPSLVGRGFRAASPAARGARHRHATRSQPKALGSRLYESIIRTFGISSLSLANDETRVIFLNHNKNRIRFGAISSGPGR